MEETTNRQNLLVAMNLSLEFGEDWQAPIHDRLLERIPELTREGAQYLETLVANVRNEAFQMIADDCGAHFDEQMVRSRVLQKHSWLDDETMSRLIRQGRYYAWRG